MSKLLVTILSLFLPLSSFGNDSSTESIPNSELAVSFPADWTFNRSYLGNGIYKSLSLTLPKGEFGGSPMYPNFDFEFNKSASLESLKEGDFTTIKINGVEAKIFMKNPEVRYLFDDFSHAYDTLQVTSYVVPLESGNLICKLTTSSENENKHAEYLRLLEEFCSSAIESRRSPNKNKQNGTS